MGYDFSDVHVHTSPEADALNRDLSAQAFTTGNDIYFREGAYDPNSSSGQELAGARDDACGAAEQWTGRGRYQDDRQCSGRCL